MENTHDIEIDRIPPDNEDGVNADIRSRVWEAYEAMGDVVRKARGMIEGVKEAKNLNLLADTLERCAKVMGQLQPLVREAHGMENKAVGGGASVNVLINALGEAKVLSERLRASPVMISSTGGMDGGTEEAGMGDESVCEGGTLSDEGESGKEC